VSRGPGTDKDEFPDSSHRGLGWDARGVADGAQGPRPRIRKTRVGRVPWQVAGAGHTT